MKVKQNRLNPLTADQIEEYDKNGYLIIRNRISEDLIDTYNRYVYELRSLPEEEMPEWVKQGMTHNQSRDFNQSRFTTRLFNPHVNDPFSCLFMKLPIFRDVLAQLLGDEAAGIQTMYFFKEPGSKGQAPHQDYHYIHNDPNTLIGIWVAMDDVDIENGCLWVIPASHKLGLLTHGEVRNRKEHDPLMGEAYGVDITQEVPVEMKKGDFIIFHNLLVHSSLSNRSFTRWRKAYVIHYIRHDSTVTKRQELKRKYLLD